MHLFSRSKPVWIACYLYVRKGNTELDAETLEGYTTHQEGVLVGGQREGG